MDPNFVRADNSNQPKIDAFTVAHFFKDNADYYAAEPKNVKQLYYSECRGRSLIGDGYRELNFVTRKLGGLDTIKSVVTCYLVHRRRYIRARVRATRRGSVQIRPIKFDKLRTISRRSRLRPDGPSSARGSSRRGPVKRTPHLSPEIPEATKDFIYCRSRYWKAPWAPCLPPSFLFLRPESTLTRNSPSVLCEFFYKFVTILDLRQCRSG
ncbi:hypothetical protein EVAR_48795_1 [Eumeta japonica]|uniref:Uncharacterized protein n=1 Tax=Eumeta variegata TaxID=151549 RepID=A0A4C2A8M3_EUMVA|nr:hypothetical protein EVAR_48795_1 [Eumeta japonica]